MELAKRLKFERKRRGMSRVQLSKLLSHLGVSFCSAASIRKWESVSDDEINVEALTTISIVYGISIEELVDGDVDVNVNINPEQEFYEIGNVIGRYCDVHDASEFFTRYQLFDKECWISAPKYDLISRLYNMYLKNDKQSLASCYTVLSVLKDWLIDVPDLHRESSEIVHNLYEDSAYVEIDDSREPAEYIQIHKELNYLQDDLGEFLEVFEDTDLEVQSWNLLER